MSARRLIAVYSMVVLEGELVVVAAAAAPLPVLR
jgi:hypothetical protein